ncbi:nuclear pore complex protein NUP35 [Phalaenopsis equestris]|uniref:nuclear pore complex protein NUP35 n=1 Tax=Phalaenopsis equestris TaxID=78828 RepID=UPI0009E52F42|nr:nuclear pore complex protein NUP35 [Phalaenopsis equestris]
MSSTSRRNSKSERQSIFFHDLASPVSIHRAGGRFTTPGQAAAVSALWHENLGGSEPPPPPVFTLEDRVDFSPEPNIGEFPTSPELGSGSRTPKHSHGYLSSPHSGRAEANSSVLSNGGLRAAKQQHQHSPGSSSWWSPVKAVEPEQEEKGRGSPVDGVVQSRALIMLPPLTEAVRPEMQKNNLHMETLDEEEWVTVYGFAPGDTNLVLREFEKCGTILKHLPGPRDANWMHILYQNRYDARRALGKNGAQINSVLIIGVKPVDYAQRQYLDERLNSSNHASLLIPSFSPRTTYGRSTSSSIAASGIGVTARPNTHLNGGGAFATDGKGQRSTGAIASPAKSVVSKVMDLMFGI